MQLNCIKYLMKTKRIDVHRLRVAFVECIAEEDE